MSADDEAPNSPDDAPDDSEDRTGTADALHTAREALRAMLGVPAPDPENDAD